MKGGWAFWQESVGNDMLGKVASGQEIAWLSAGLLRAHLFAVPVAVRCDGARRRACRAAALSLRPAAHVPACLVRALVDRLRTAADQAAALRAAGLPCPAAVDGLAARSAAGRRHAGRRAGSAGWSMRRGSASSRSLSGWLRWRSACRSTSAASRSGASLAPPPSSPPAGWVRGSRSTGRRCAASLVRRLRHWLRSDCWRAQVLPARRPDLAGTRASRAPSRRTAPARTRRSSRRDTRSRAWCS